MTQEAVLRADVDRMIYTLILGPHMTGIVLWLSHLVES